MIRRFNVRLLLAVLLFTVSFAEAQQPPKIPRIGRLAIASRSVESARLEAFGNGLRDLGYVEGKNIVIEWRFADGKLDRLPAQAAELVRLKAEIIVSAVRLRPAPPGPQLL